MVWKKLKYYENFYFASTYFHSRVLYKIHRTKRKRASECFHILNKNVDYIFQACSNNLRPGSFYGIGDWCNCNRFNEFVVFVRKSHMVWKIVVHPPFCVRIAVVARPLTILSIIKNLTKILYLALICCFGLNHLEFQLKTLKFIYYLVKYPIKTCHKIKNSCNVLCAVER